MKNNYDTIARYYDFLSRTIFQRSIINAQVALLSYIKPNSTVLIVGGGTGWILEKFQPAGLEITYVEISESMLALSKKRIQHNNVEFIHQSIEDFVPSHPYDIIFTPFLFDNFSAANAAVIFDKLHACLKTGGDWLFADFIDDPRQLWQQIMLKTMYLFFKVFAKIEAGKLNDMDGLFHQYHYQKIDEKFHYGRFICAAVYRKELLK
jgi:ubiquinone/menaquinone biosynthesis C-methylase UbiE